MGPELWILVGAGAVLSCLGLGVWAGWSLGASALKLVTYERDELRRIVRDLEEQAVSAKSAASAVIDAERSLAAASGAGPSGLVRLLNDDGKPATVTTGEADGTPRPAAGPLAEGA